MAQSGWISIRNVPKVYPKDDIAEARFYYNALESFFQKYMLCPLCRGKGTITKKSRDTKDTIIKYRGINDLEILKYTPDVSMSSVIREILGIQFEGLKACPTCKGRKYLPRNEE